MEFKGTKGKWVIDGDHISTGHHPNDETICDIHPSTEYPTVKERSFEEAKANAKLISKAPEMLKELKNTLDVIEIIRMITGNKDIGGHLGSSEYRIKQLIKEATTL